jgi:hypothetical protein
MTISRVPMTLPVLVAGVMLACAGAYLASAWRFEPTGDPRDPPLAAAPVDSPEGASPAARLPASAVLGSRYQLQGVVAESAAEGAGGVALIAVDGAVARALRVGDAVSSDFVLLAVSPAGAILGAPHGPPMVVLEVTPGASVAKPPPEGIATVAAAVAPMPAAAPASSDLQMAAPSTEPTVALPAIDLAIDTPPRAATPQMGRPQPGRRLRLHHQTPLH